ncbi:MAG: UTP--glucose-1-phosphate uridylyltransferase [Verrucomicrobia bacterium]|nr:UTP--glucose-1-phosphate uridylyltransferase [Verrucomicrobiota bacterium]
MNPAPTPALPLIEAKMAAHGIGRPTIAAFLTAVRQVAHSAHGLLPEADLEPVTDLPRLDTMPAPTPAEAGLLRQLVIVKLNGGLGTGMGLDRAKSLIRVRDDATFLDFIVRQVLHLRQQVGAHVPAFYLMNSASTRPSTLEFLRNYPALTQADTLDFLQNLVPKLDPHTYEPIAWPPNPSLEWCPPGHGDFYPSLLGCGLLDRLLAQGIRYAFVSNSDNLGATVDLRVLRYLAETDLSFLMEVADRTAADRKGGHLARHKRTGRLLLRESAQCPAAETASFQDIQRHRFFNTNNLWLRLDHLHEELSRHGGHLPLPLILNRKTVDARQPNSPKVLQLESAMGAAIECFARADGIVVPRARFAPVKATVDLLALRSDAYIQTADHRLVLAESRRGKPPLIQLDPPHYRVLAQFERHFPAGAPSLVGCDSLKVTGPIQFPASVVCQGHVEFHNPHSEVKTVPANTYRNTRLGL